MEGVFVVYVLKNAEGKRYIGITSKIDQRMEAHNKGLSLYTRRHRPWEIHWISRDLDHKNALLLEKRMKRQKGGKGLQDVMTLYARGS